MSDLPEMNEKRGLKLNPEALEKRISELEKSREGFLKIFRSMENLINSHTKQIAELKELIKTEKELGMIKYEQWADKLTEWVEAQRNLESILSELENSFQNHERGQPNHDIVVRDIAELKSVLTELLMIQKHPHEMVWSEDCLYCKLIKRLGGDAQE